jgi:hypothetical protein
LILRNSLEIFYVLKAIEIISTAVEIIRAPRPKGAALKTYLRSGRKFNKENIAIMINLKTFSEIAISPV